MTKDELKKKLDEYIGIESKYHCRRYENDEQLVYTSPTEIVLFAVDIGNYAGNWRIVDLSSCLPFSTKDIISLIEKGESNETSKAI